tara:strand:- start:2881 stop:4332 length:1452 start_codon:yes stop_codon:yes gene_type:complete
MNIIRTPNIIFYTLLAIANFFAFIFIEPHFQLFDSALFKLQLIYPTQGWAPYKDFVFIYPFGPSLVSLFIDKLSFGAFNLITFIWPLHFLLQLVLINQIRKIYLNKNIHVIVSILVIETLVTAKLGGEPFSTLLTFIVFLEYFITYQNKKITWKTFVYSTVLCFVRWDRLVFCICTLFLYRAFCKKKRVDFEIIHTTKLFLISLSAIFFLIFSIFIYENENFYNSMQYIFIDPFIIAKLRSLPFTLENNFLSIINTYYLIILIYIILGYFLIKEKFDNHKTFFYFLGLTLFIPSLSRSDVGHFLPFYVSSLFLIYSLPIFVSSFYLKNKKFILYFNGIFCITVLIFSLLTNKSHIKNTCNSFNNIKNAYKSIFVGNSQYDNFNINYPYLYLQNLNLKPATKFISDEPGIQNDCARAEEIIRDIDAAPKPTIFYLNKTILKDKNNTNQYQNCGLLEKYFSTKTKVIGYCEVNQSEIEVRAGYER